MGQQIAFAKNACLAARDAAEGCRDCLNACPVGALTQGEQGPQIEKACMGCGRCIVACPTGALASSEFDLLHGLVPGDTRLRLECRATPRAFLDPGTLVVPCLGGVTEEDLVALALAVGMREIEVVDRGWCEGCQAGLGDRPAQDLVARTDAVFQALDLGDAAPRHCFEPLRPAHRLDIRERQRATRRDFFRRMMPARELVGPSANHPGTRRSRRANLLTRLAARHGKPVPASLHPRLSVSAACRAHQVCHAICPTGALGALRDESRRGLVFEATKCLACGWCANACPESAIEAFDAGTKGEFLDGPVVLVRHATQTCVRCEDDFVGDGDLCPACVKSRALFASGPLAARRAASAPEGGHHHDHA
ncbi:MAG: hypothetical protein FJX47_21470 [Alphaproteobacteria bacterium]|nr:hypothetical protein [Alphaproteobacteria bacterium]